MLGSSCSTSKERIWKSQTSIRRQCISL